jgi:hypothetical protein
MNYPAEERGIGNLYVNSPTSSPPNVSIGGPVPVSPEHAVMTDLGLLICFAQETREDESGEIN